MAVSPPSTDGFRSRLGPRTVRCARRSPPSAGATVGISFGDRRRRRLRLAAHEAAHCKIPSADPSHSDVAAYALDSAAALSTPTSPIRRRYPSCWSIWAASPRSGPASAPARWPCAACSMAYACSACARATTGTFPTGRTPRAVSRSSSWPPSPRAAPRAACRGGRRSAPAIITASPTPTRTCTHPYAAASSTVTSAGYSSGAIGEPTSYRLRIWRNWELRLASSLELALAVLTAVLSYAIARMAGTGGRLPVEHRAGLPRDLQHQFGGPCGAGPAM